MGKSPFEQLIAALAPLECIICKREKFMLCPSCAEKILSEPESRCYICNKLTKQHTVCPSCRSSSRLRRVWWLGDLETTLKDLIYQMKFHRGRAYARAFGDHLATALPYLDERTIVVPIPTASQRIRRRSFDQAVLIAQQLAATRSLPYAAALERTTQADQIGKSRAQRRQQMREAFVVKQIDRVAKQSILLVDDVLTTGATLEAAATHLRQAGALHVDAIVIARQLKI